MGTLDLQIENYETRFKKIVGFDVVLSIIWFQYFQMRLQHHSEQLGEASFLDALWSSMINPTVIGIILSSLSVWICITGLRIIREGRALGQIRLGTTVLLSLWWGVFLILESGGLVVSAVNIGHLTTGLDIIMDLVQTVMDAVMDAFR